MRIRRILFVFVMDSHLEHAGMTFNGKDDNLKGRHACVIVAGIHEVYGYQKLWR